MKVIHLIKAAWKNRDRIGDGTQDRELAAFLPAALDRNYLFFSHLYILINIIGFRI